MVAEKKFKQNQLYNAIVIKVRSPISKLGYCFPVFFFDRMQLITHWFKIMRQLMTRNQISNEVSYHYSTTRSTFKVKGNWSSLNI